LDDSELIRDFVNTKHIHPGLEEDETLTSPGALASWLEAKALLPEPGSGSVADLRQAIALREALRRILLANNGVEIDTSGPFEVLDTVARRGRIELRFAEGAGELSPATRGVPAALGRLVIAVHRAMEGGSWSRLKACRASDCEWAFIDSARNQSRAWCSMRSCGNREKARAFRERHHHAPGASSSSR
jgi:predicted RNA-binding Zn ribbon-like protein